MFRKALRAIRRGLNPPAVIDRRVFREAVGEFFHLPDLLVRPRHLNEAAIRAARYNAYLGDYTAICSVLGRYRLFVDTRDIGLSSHLLTFGFWEIWHTEALMHLVKPGMKAVDVGANLGYFTVLLGEIVGPTGSVHAFEPNPDIAARLRNSVSVNGWADRTTVHEYALGARDGKAKLAIPAGDPKNAHVVKTNAPIGNMEIRVSRWDALPELVDADFIKIDVEGSEEGLWQGMEDFLSRGRSVTIVLEFTAARYRDAGEFLDRILSSGFSLDVIDPFAGIIPLTQEELLARPSTTDQLIVLRR